LTSTELERAIAENAGEGRQLTHLSAVGIAREPRFSAVFLQTAAGGDMRVRQGLTSAELFTELDTLRNTRVYTQALAGYELDGRAAFAAAWREGATA
jgi:Polyglycine hydrolase-like, structural repeat